MNAQGRQDLLEKLAAKYALRYVEKDNRYFGLCAGLIVDAWDSEGSLRIFVYSPTVNLPADAVINKGEGFPHIAQTPVPPDWVQFRMLGKTFDAQSCFVELDGTRLATISETDVLGILEALALDFHAHGASPDAPPCALCGEARAAQAIFANDHYQAACQACADRIRDFIPGRVVELEVPINWKKALTSLALWSVGFAVIWGYILQSGHGIDTRVLFAGPFIGSIWLCRALGKAAQGMSLGLRCLTVACILVSTLAGNIWGLKTELLKQWDADVTWLQTISAYFTQVVPAANGNEWYYLIGALAGTWLGFGWLKRQNVVRYR
jgi:hypothetical protein